MRQWSPDLPRGGETKGLFLPFLAREGPLIEGPFGGGTLIEGPFCGGIVLPATVDIRSDIARNFVLGGSVEQDPFDDEGGEAGGGGGGNLFGGNNGGGNSKPGDADGQGVVTGGGDDPDEGPFKGVDWQGKTDRPPPTYLDYKNWYGRRVAKEAAQPRPIQYFVNNRPASYMGILNRLPGEVRNKIYRFSLIDDHDGLITIKMKPNTCAVGPCVHSEAHTALPGLLTTCRQIRWEAAAIYFAENRGFKFDDQVVQQGCVPNFLCCIQDYINEIQQFHFAMKRQRVVPPVFVPQAPAGGQWLPTATTGDFNDWVEWDMSIVCPPPEYVGNNYEFQSSTLHVDGSIHDTCTCELKGLVSRMNHRKQTVLNNTEVDLFDPYADLPYMPVGDFVLELVESETFSNFVYQLRKTTGSHGVTHRCPDCLGTDFVYQAPQED